MVCGGYFFWLYFYLSEREYGEGRFLKLQFPPETAVRHVYKYSSQSEDLELY